MFFELTLLLSLIVAGYVYVNKKKKEKANGLPPGPWGFPLLGHLPLLGRQPHKKLVAWKKIYGPIFSIRFGSFPSIVLQDTKMIKEAFAHPAFAGRADMPSFSESSGGRGIATSNGPANTEQRLGAIKILKDFGLLREAMTFRIQDEIQSLMEYVKVKERGDWMQVQHMFHVFVINALWTIMMSDKFETEDPFIQHFAYLITTRVAGTDRRIPKLSLLWPALGRWFPELSGHNDTVQAFNEIYGYVETKINERKLTWVKDQPRDFTDAYFDKVAETKDESSSFHAKYGGQTYITGDLLVAGTETTSSSLEWFLYYMGKNPSVQKKLQTEIDSAIDRSELPNLSHRRRIPYAEAVVLELLRISTVTPLGVFHRTVQQVEFQGFKIPADTVVISNLYGIHHDPELWGDPQNFRPERFLMGGEEEEEDGRMMMRKMENFLPFSFGRRNCVGEGLARDELFLFVTSLCQTFTIVMPQGTPDLVPTFGITLSPPPFQVKFVERQL